MQRILFQTAILIFALSLFNRTIYAQKFDVNEKKANSFDSSFDNTTFNKYSSLAIDDKLNTLDLKVFFKQKNDILLGLSLISYKWFDDGLGITPFIAYKHLVNKKVNVWGDLGYNFSWFFGKSSFTSFGVVSIPSYTTSNLIWEIGVDYFYNKNRGLTLYSAKFNSIFLGITYRLEKK